MTPGDTRVLTFETLRHARGFRNEGGDTRLVSNGTFLDNFELAPAIGMDRGTVLRDRAKRRAHGLPVDLRPAKLEDASAVNKPSAASWTTADITLSTAADQTVRLLGYSNGLLEASEIE